MTTGFNPDRFDALVRELRRRYDVSEPTPLDLETQFVYSFLLWEASAADAERAFKRVTSAVVDYNELRISLPDELVDLLGVRYPRVEERAMRMRAALNELFLREHAVSFERLKDAPKRESRQYVESLDGVPPFVAARVSLLGFGGHAAPLDDRTLERLVEDEVFESGTPLDRAIASLERHIKATHGVETHILLMQRREDAKPAAPKSRRSAAKAPRAKAAKPAKTAKAPRAASSRSRKS